jgi:hypothetical protein
MNPRTFLLDDGEVLGMMEIGEDFIVR